MNTGTNPVGRILFGCFVYILSATTAAAIPSPELIIGSAASISQLFAFGAAFLGGGAVLVGRRAAAAKKNDIRARKRLLKVGFSLFFVALVLAGLNIFQYQNAKQDRLTRLQATLNRPAVIVDANLRETSFAAQSSDRLGISTQEAATALATGDVLFIDVRETAENQMGTIPGAVHIRFPDVDLTDPRFKGREVVLLCHNGNRSSETCEKLAALGIDCRFIVGGIEKWIVEGRPFTDETVRTLSDLRAIPDYANKDLLLDTPDVSALVAEQDVQFIDVRYPGDFARGHLPGAINLPMRATPTAEISKLIAALPDKPIVAACYDRRGCFISQVLGYELAQAGLDFRGRYTLPWEYFVPKDTKPHVALWLAEQNQGSWQRAISGLATGLNWLGDKTHFLFAVFALALATRLLILPIAIKAERDQITTARIAPELAALKERYKDDPSGKPEALKVHYAKHGLSPGRNMLTLLFLPITMLGLSAVQRAGTGQAGFAWLKDLGVADPLYVLPALATTLGCIYLQLAIGTTPRRAVLSWVIGFPVLGLLILQLSAAGAIYLVIALGLLFIQRAYVTGVIGRITNKVAAFTQQIFVTRFYDGIIPLKYTGLLGNAGNKALRLSQLSRAGFPVPGGVVLGDRFLDKFAKASDQQRAKIANRINRFFGSNAVAVRSSATAEDGDNLSFAGVFESRLDVTASGLVQAIEDVSASFNALHTRAYADGGRGNILIQRMVQPEFAGVLFTADPQQPGIAMVEFAKGIAEDLVSGRVVPTTCRFGRSTMALLDGAAPMDFTPLLEMGRKIEQFFDGPQDIEWTYCAGKFAIVQSRNITTLKAETNDMILSEWSRLIEIAGSRASDQPLLVQDEMSEVLPRPTPLSLSYMQALWSPDGSVGLACARLGVRYNPGNESHLTTVFGRLYSDVARKSRTALNVPRKMRKHFDSNPDEVADSYEHDFLPKLDRRLAQLNATDFSVIETELLPGIVTELFEEFISDIHVEVEVVNIAAGYYVQRAVELCDREKLDAAALIMASGGVSPASLLRFVDANDNDLRREKLLEYFGHRAPHDYELSDLRYWENTQQLEGLLAAADVGVGKNERPKLDENQTETVRSVIETAQSYQSLKDAAKHQALRFLAEIRRGLEALDQGLGYEGLIHYLTLEELGKVSRFNTSLSSVAKARRQQRDQLLKQKALPSTLTMAQLEAAIAGVSVSGAAKGDSLLGKRVSGDKRSVGRVYQTSREQAESGEKLIGFKVGDILACSFVHPNWLPYVLKSGGVIAEVGGWLSHIAIVARENNKTLVVGVSGWEALPHGADVAIEVEGQVRLIELPKVQNELETEMPKLAVGR